MSGAPEPMFAWADSPREQKRQPLDVLLSNLSSAVSLAVLMAIATWVIFIVPAAVIAYRLAF